MGFLRNNFRRKKRQTGGFFEAAVQNANQEAHIQAVIAAPLKAMQKQRRRAGLSSFSVSTSAHSIVSSSSVPSIDIVTNTFLLFAVFLVGLFSKACADSLRSGMRL